MSWEKRTTLKDVAGRLGLSVAAVSLALRNHPSISAATTAKVKAMARELNYAPDPGLSALAAHRSRLRVHRDFSVIALVTNWSSRDAWTTRTSAKQAIEGVTLRARSLGYSLQVFWAREQGCSARRFSAVLRNRGIRGVILAPFEDPRDRLDLEWKDFAVVALERPVQYPLFHHIVPNHFAGILLAWEQLRARNYTRIGIIVWTDLSDRTLHQWEAGYAYLQSRTLEANRVSALVLQPEDPVGQIRSWLRRERPEAVISRSDGFFEAVRAEGLRIPQDIGYASLNVADDVPQASGIQQHRSEMGEFAVEILNSLLQSNQRGFNAVPHGTHVDGTWQEGRTVRGLPAARKKAREPR
ncbi:LacI family transcriptional regulator [Horticoccus luteus]|uniref:LacI family transcriptional regulator n=1 Tax=Horticoccus luteus TaxID=2862869 RepID=A0A8F9TV03_9BACT|nr:LacI family DNA-binding transcriptional regulator [Horticoccus luteus]QYM78620.1 LacI family transcriptional regulator [Horticoccus luteus]